MSVVRYRKRPTVVDTIQWTGHNADEVRAFAGAIHFHAVGPEDRYRVEDPDITAEVWDELHSTWVGVKTGQHIVRGVRREYYPIAEDVLAETYELADADGADLLPKADVVAWLTKKARENTPIEQLASKVARGAIRPDNLRMLPPDFFEPDRSYTRIDRFGLHLRFDCEHITRDPKNGQREAWGWLHRADGTRRMDRMWDASYPKWAVAGESRG